MVSKCNWFFIFLSSHIIFVLGLWAVSLLSNQRQKPSALMHVKLVKHLLFAHSEFSFPHYTPTLVVTCAWCTGLTSLALRYSNAVSLNGYRQGETGKRNSLHIRRMGAVFTLLMQSLHFLLNLPGLCILPSAFLKVQGLHHISSSPVWPSLAWPWSHAVDPFHRM